MSVLILLNVKDEYLIEDDEEITQAKNACLTEGDEEMIPIR